MKLDLSNVDVIDDDTGEVIRTVKEIVRSAVVVKMYSRKDDERARGITIYTDATKMAKLITNTDKIICRTKAVVHYFGMEHPYVKPFLRRLKELGFNNAEIEYIKHHPM